MKKNNFAFGICLVILGIIFLLKSFKILEFTFTGWWTLFIIIPSLIGLINQQDKTGNIITLLIGIFLLLASRGVITWEVFKKLILPSILVILGVSLILKDLIPTGFNQKIKTIKEKDNNNYLALFGGQTLNFREKEFLGANFQAIFGGIDCNLTNSLIKDEIVINTYSIFGGIDLIIPDDIQVIIKSTSIFGGVEDLRKNKKAGQKTIYIKAVSIFGGVDIK